MKAKPGAVRRKQERKSRMKVRDAIAKGWKVSLENVTYYGLICAPRKGIARAEGPGKGRSARKDENGRNDKN